MVCSDVLFSGNTRLFEILTFLFITTLSWSWLSLTVCMAAILVWPIFYNQIYNWTNVSWNCTAYFLDARALLITEHVIVLCMYAAHSCLFNYKSDYSTRQKRVWLPYNTQMSNSSSQTDTRHVGFETVSHGDFKYGNECKTLLTVFC